MQKKRKEFNIRVIGELYYITHNTIIKENDSVYDDILFKCILNLGISGIEAEKIYASNDPKLDTIAKIPALLLPKLRASKKQIITLKVEKIADEIAPIVDKNNCIIVDMWKL